MQLTEDELAMLIRALLEQQKSTNVLLNEILRELKVIREFMVNQLVTRDVEESLDLFDPQVLLKYNKRLQEVIKEIAKFFQKGNDKMVVEDLQKLMNISYPQAAHYLNELEKDGLIVSRRGDRTKGENPLKKYYYLP